MRVATGIFHLFPSPAHQPSQPPGQGLLQSQKVLHPQTPHRRPPSPQQPLLIQQIHQINQQILQPNKPNLKLHRPASPRVRKRAPRTRNLPRAADGALTGAVSRVHEELDALGDAAEPGVQDGVVGFPPSPELGVLHADGLAAGLVGAGHDLADGALAVFPEDEGEHGVEGVLWDGVLGVGVLRVGVLGVGVLGVGVLLLSVLDLGFPWLCGLRLGVMSSGV